ncbi:MAG TPA: FecR domain-containing protein [Devosia sp.]|nr:FecR domain-containing protein [Devosia sp.]
MASRLGLVALALFFATPASATGTALGVDPAASIETAVATRTLVVGDDIAIGDRIVTDAAGVVQVKFDDGTLLVIGPRSALVIEDFLQRADDSAGRFVIEALSGTFRFVTGTAAKDRYEISLPTGMIGVRGTAFDFHVDVDATSILAYEGEVLMCADGEACKPLRANCGVGQIDAASARRLGPESQNRDSRTFRVRFPFAIGQGGLLPAFRLDMPRTACSLKD